MVTSKVAYSCNIVNSFSINTGPKSKGSRLTSLLFEMSVVLQGRGTVKLRPTTTIEYSIFTSSSHVRWVKLYTVFAWYTHWVKLYTVFAWYTRWVKLYTVFAWYTRWVYMHP